MENNFEVINVIVKNLKYSLTRIRLEIERSYYQTKINQSAPKTTYQNDTFFTKLKKNTSNMFNNYTYNKYVEKYKQINSYIDNYIRNNRYHIFYYEYEIIQKVKELFINDKYGLAKLEFIMDLITSDPYDYETNEEGFAEISRLLDLNSNSLMNTYNKMQRIYSDISLNKRNINTKALTIASLIAIPLLITGVGAVIGGYAVAGSVTTAGLAGAGLGLGMAEGVAILCLASAVTVGVTYGITYKSLEISQKNQLKKEFAALTVEQTTMVLVKTMVSMIHLRSFNNLEAKQLYKSYVEQYIDLKNDCDIRLFLKEDKVLENKDKNSIFANADTFLKKYLFE